MQPPPNTEVIESSIFKMWMDPEGILCLDFKKNPPQILEESKMTLDGIKKLCAGQKRLMLMNFTNFELPSKESRDYGAQELPPLAIAIAIVSQSTLGALVANLFFTLKRQSYPSKIFSDEQKAREWLKQFLIIPKSDSRIETRPGYFST